MSPIRKILDFFSASKNAKDKIFNDHMTNKTVYNELSQHFKTKLEELSVGTRMLYPMSFNILMCQDDYESTKESFPFILPEIVSSFYKIIEEKKSTFPNFEPPAKYWFFQFTACRQSQIEAPSGEVKIIQKGHITTIASLLAFDISNKQTETNTRVSIKLQDSNVMNDVNINLNAIRNIDVISEGTFKFKFDKDLKQDSKSIRDSNVGTTDGLAVFTYTENGANVHYTMMDNLINISGSSDSRTGRQILKINSDKIINSHVQVKYIASESKFQIAAYAKTLLNGRTLQLSSGGDVIWYDLANKSKIFINDAISVYFEKTDSDK